MRQQAIQVKPATKKGAKKITVQQGSAGGLECSCWFKTAFEPQYFVHAGDEEVVATDLHRHSSAQSKGKL